MRSKICYDDILKIKCFVLNAIDLFLGWGVGEVQNWHLFLKISWRVLLSHSKKNWRKNTVFTFEGGDGTGGRGEVKWHSSTTSCMFELYNNTCSWIYDIRLCRCSKIYIDSFQFDVPVLSFAEARTFNWKEKLIGHLH